MEALLYICLLPEGKYASTRSIAENTGISEGYLEQLFIPLRQAGIVKGIRGPQGGYLPGKAPCEITIGEILRVVEGPLEPVACAAQDKLCARENECLSRHTSKELYHEIADCVNSITLSDLTSAYNSIENPGYAI